MGIITRVYHHSEDLLGPQRFKELFFDMAENIHLHYRDFRIEFSVAEFLEFAEHCEEYFPQVRAEIEAGYMDGVLPNTNQTDTYKKFSNGKKLEADLAYSPRAISLEQNSDGYHVHIRNYKLLFTKEEFFTFARAASDTLNKRKEPLPLQEAIQLMIANGLDHVIESKPSNLRATIAMDRKFYRKGVQLLKALGFQKSQDLAGGGGVFRVAGTRIDLRNRMIPATLLQALGPSRAPDGATVIPLRSFVKTRGPELDANQSNLLKCQILDFCMYLKEVRIGHLVHIDYDELLFNPLEARVIFPAKVRPAPVDVQKKCAELLAEITLTIKRAKSDRTIYGPEKAEKLQTAFRTYLRDRLVSPCVDKIWLLNPGGFKKAGRYHVPCVQFSWAKLGSDFDLYIELDESQPIPAWWDLKFAYAGAFGDYYHLGNVDFPIEGPHADAYPNIDFYHHMVEAYVFYPSRGLHKEKDAYLARYNSELLYDKATGWAIGDDAAGQPAADEDPVTELLATRYGMTGGPVGKGGPSVFSDVQRVKTGAGEFALKVTGRTDHIPALSDAYRNTHHEYEATVLAALADERTVISPVAGLDGLHYQPAGDRIAMLFPWVEANATAPRSDAALDAAAKALGGAHRALRRVTAPTNAYDFTHFLTYSINHFNNLAPQWPDPQELCARFTALTGSIPGAVSRLGNLSALPWLHSHGDVCPQNILHRDDGALLIDWQVVHWAPRIADLAGAALEFSVRGTHLDPGLIDRFEKVYRRSVRLTKAEQAALPAMRHIQALMKLSTMLRLRVIHKAHVDEKRTRAYLEFAEAQAAALE